MKDRWTGSIAVGVLALTLSGCNILQFPLAILKNLSTMLVGLFEKVGPLAAAAFVQATPAAPVDPAADPALQQQLREQLKQQQVIVAQRLDARDGRPAPALRELPTPDADDLAAIAAQRGARSVALIDVSRMSEQEATAWLRRVAAAGGEVLVVDGSQLRDPAARARLAAQLGDARLIER